jgi:DNA-binding NarL/FixJ family response regulator
MTIRVLIADDDEVIRIPLRMLVEREPDLTVVAEARDGREAVALTAAHRPDVVVLDVRMPLLSGVEATRAIRQAGTPAKILVLTTFDLDEYVHDALRSGADGFLLKNTPPHRFVEAIRLVEAGEAVLAPAVTARLVDAFTRNPPPAPHPGLDELTDRERDVLILVADGLSNRQIASRLGLSESNVKSRLNRILSRLGAANRVQAALLARSAGLSGWSRPPSAGRSRPAR